MLRDLGGFQILGPARGPPGGEEAIDSRNRDEVSVFCADDHAGFRATLRDLIEATPGFALIGEASSGADAIALVPQLRPDLVLMDIRMPGMNGFEAAARLMSDDGDLLIVLMSADPIEAARGSRLRAGEVTIVAKRELSRRRLLELWHGREAPNVTG
jgi:DNA-binding NarL/FixJ family response regulator